MGLKVFITLVNLTFVLMCHAQKDKKASTIDSSFTDYDALFSELDALLDSLATPRSHTLVNLGAGQSFLTYESQDRQSTETKRKIYITPSIWYFNKSGLGIGMNTTLMNIDSGMRPYQFAVTGSFDYRENEAFLTGVSFTHYITKNDLSFYTSPLRNTANGYFSYRKSRLKPSIGVSYGWGSKDNITEKDERIKKKKTVTREITSITTTESITDFNVFASFSHDFYFLDISSDRDYLRIAPQITFTSGTQQYGFNQTASTYIMNKRSGRSVLDNSENTTFDNSFHFRPLSLTAFLKTEYSRGSFFFQPQVIVDYYFPAATNNTTVAFVLNTGIIF